MASLLNLTVKGISVGPFADGKGSFEPVSFQRHAPGPKDVAFDIKFCGVCHSDLHHVENASNCPACPGHEMAGIVTFVGAEVTKFKIGDKVGVGCMVDSCQTCEYCVDYEEQYCNSVATFTYGDKPKFGRAGVEKTRGGYSTMNVVQERFAIKIPESMPLEVAGPIMCAGITMYDPLKHWNAGSAHVKRVGIVGGGGLGHMGIKIAKAMGCTVTAITTSPSKIEHLKSIGATYVVLSTNAEQMTAAKRSLDLILNTISADHDIMMYHAMLRPNGNIIQLGLVQKPHIVPQVPLLFTRCGISGSLIGGTRATQEVVDLCAAQHIYPDIKVMPCSAVAQIYTELAGKSANVQRFVLDIAGTMDAFHGSA